MKTILALAVCLAVATPTLCQSASTPKDQQEKEQQLRTVLEQMRDAIDRYHGLFIREKSWPRRAAKDILQTSKSW